MKINFIHPVLLCLIHFNPLSSGQGLEWNASTLEVTAEPGASSVERIYSFENKSDEAVTIQSIQTGCDCTEAVTDKKTYEPGDKGVLLVTFDIGEREGPQKKKITVLTNDPEHPVHELTFKTTLPFWCHVEPPILNWSSETSGQPLAARLVPAEGRVISNVRLKKPGEHFSIDFTKGDKVWHITATPRSSASAVETPELIVTFAGDVQKTRKLVLRQFDSKSLPN
jgi:hypothetical protein